MRAILILGPKSSITIASLGRVSPEAVAGDAGALLEGMGRTAGALGGAAGGKTGAFLTGHAGIGVAFGPVAKGLPSGAKDRGGRTTLGAVLALGDVVATLGACCGGWGGG